MAAALTSASLLMAGINKYFVKLVRTKQVPSVLSKVIKLRTEDQNSWQSYLWGVEKRLRESKPISLLVSLFKLFLSIRACIIYII